MTLVNFLFMIGVDAREGGGGCWMSRASAPSRSRSTRSLAFVLAKNNIATNTSPQPDHPPLTPRLAQYTVVVMKQPRKKDNLALEIELLRARLGSKPSIKLAQVMASGKGKICKNFKHVGQNVKRVALSKQEAKARLQELVDKKEGGVFHHEFNDIRSTCKKLLRLELAKVRHCVCFSLLPSASLFVPSLYFSRRSACSQSESSRHD